ncbi:MAG: MFS transporter [Clostridiaceae bacterium]
MGNNDNFRFYTMNGILFTIVTIFTRTYAPKFMDRLGATSLHYSLLNSLPGLVAVLTTIPGIIYIQNSKDKEKLMSRFFYISRFFPLLLVATPYLPLNIRGYVFVILFSLMNLPESIGQTALQSWTGNIFRPHEVADALSIRNKLSQVTMIVFSILVGVLLSISNSGDNTTVILIYQGLFIASLLFGIFEIRSLRKIKIVRPDLATKKLDLPKSLGSIFKHKQYVIFLVCSLLFHFGWQMGWPLFSYFQISILHADEKWLTIINVVNALAMVFSYNFWSSFIRKRGSKIATAFACLGMATSPILAVLSPNLPIYTLIGITMGFFTSGITVVILGSLLESAAPDETLLSIAVHQTLINVTLFTSPFVGEIILQLSDINVAMFVSALLRAIGALAFFLRWYFLDIKPTKLKKVKSGPK